MRKYEITIFEKDGGRPIFTETVTAKDYNEAFRIVEAHCIAEKVTATNWNGCAVYSDHFNPKFEQ